MKLHKVSEYISARIAESEHQIDTLAIDSPSVTAEHQIVQVLEVVARLIEDEPSNDRRRFEVDHVFSFGQVELCLSNCVSALTNARADHLGLAVEMLREADHLSSIEGQLSYDARQRVAVRSLSNACVSQLVSTKVSS